jgi:hypothetical protein
MGTTTLEVYNNALVLLGDRKLASLSENREPRRVFDDVFTKAKTFCLEQGIWQFALLQASIAGTANTDTGFSYRFAKPTDLVHLFAIGANKNIDPCYSTEYLDLGAYYYSNDATIYVRYTSNGASYGLDLTKWSATFSAYVETYLAWLTCHRLTGNLGLQSELAGECTRRLANAMALGHVWMLPGQMPFNSLARWRAQEASGAAENRPDLVPFNQFGIWGAPGWSGAGAPAQRRGREG